MRQWTQNKPRGFGEGKVYDTSVEDKLLEELEQSRAAQNANVENLKKNPQDGNPKEKVSKQKVSEVPPNGTRVRLVHLPKKKNIHRDLQAAFKPFTGITNIIPAVIGNEKTRDPVCKGFAFVDFKSEKEAIRFVNTFSTQPMTFGKVQKQIKCEIMKPSSPIPSVKPSVPRMKTSLPVTDPSVLVISTPVTETSLDSYEEDAALDRLKMKEKDMLSGVFSKYSGKSAMAGKGTEVIAD
ncbi:nucleotide-binding alpha-beta plait domain-containing protein [Artemisia annua]|uniref:Nucleotide-binding alpha-beta plait domain-containing protein n=1 Tax=Artemisia annua TaxID=35608 RepID=A0A2U1LCK4_ARTAN|nr:nucleotide-binding alpha-beta plait domain-containing protein [Artemisia annua]